MFIKENRRMLILTSILCLAPILAGLLLWDKLPNMVPTHFGSDGAANDWSPKAFAVCGLPLLMLAVELIIAFTVRQDPKSENLRGKAVAVFLWIFPILSWDVSYTVLCAGLGRETNIGRNACITLGLIFAAIGNALPKLGQNYSAGIRTGWALNDPENWRRTQRFAGFVFTVGGILIAVLGTLLTRLRLMIPLFILMVLLPIGYSFIWYKKHGEEDPEEI